MTTPPPISVTVRAYEELNDLLPQLLRKKDFSKPLESGSTVADLLEDLEIPCQMVDLVLINGESAALDTELFDGDRASLYPVFESLDITSISRLDHAPLRRPCFAVEEGFRDLACLLRFLGFDAVILSDRHDSRAAETFAGNPPGRVLLCRTRHDPAHTDWQHKVVPGSEEPWKQALEVLRRLDLVENIGLFPKQGTPRHEHHEGESRITWRSEKQIQKLLQALSRAKQKSR
jgi:hypothetical protein